MRNVTKKLVTLGMTALMAAGTFTTAFAGNEGAVKLYGQELQQRGSSEDGREEYVAIVVGSDTIGVDDFSTVDSSKSFQNLDMVGGSWWSKAEPFKLTELSDLADLRFMALNNDDSYYEHIETKMDNGSTYVTNKATELDGKIRLMEFGLGGQNTNGADRTANIYVCKLASNVSVESLGDLSKYVVYANGSTQTEQSDIFAEWWSDTELFLYDSKSGEYQLLNASWKQDSKGWRIQFTDGTYLTNAWSSNMFTDYKFYYLGADGYMLTNTTTPDGSFVGADGAWDGI